jgi:hypothetical protein
MDLENQIFTNK